jgi:glycosyltransferase involved in cell wall biosynthesis
MKEFAGKRVLFLIENNTYPDDPRVRHEANTLVDHGYHVSVISPRRGKRQPSRELMGAVAIYRFRAAPDANGFLAYVWEYTYSMVAIFALSLVVLAREGFDIIHAANPPDTLVLIAAFYKLLGKRFIYDHHDLAPEMYYARFKGDGSPLVRWALIAFEKLSCQLADHIIATNESYKAMEMHRSGVPANRITIVRNGPDLSRFQPTAPDPQLRQKATHVIAYAGVMGVQDGIDYLLRALHHLVYDLRRSDFYCVLVGGSGDARPMLKALASKLGLNGYVGFTEWVSDAEYVRYLSTADICVDPDPSNPFNDRSTMNKITEYMALSKPIVAFDLPEHRFSAGEAALYIGENNELEFARALALLMDDPERRAAMGQSARRRIETELAWCHSVEHLLQAYDKVCRIGAEPGIAGRLASKAHRLLHWAKLRNRRYLVSRLLSLLERYGLSTTKAKRRVVNCVTTLARYGCRPTLAVPGRVVHNNARFCRELQDMGAELALHGYDHVDFNSLTPAEADRQLTLAMRAFQQAGIQFEGLRCPYLSATEELLKMLPSEVRYSSNQTVWWDTMDLNLLNGNRAIFESLSRFYRPMHSSRRAATPRMLGNVLEIPASVPDDIQLCDGLKLKDEGLKCAWLDRLNQTHRRGELLVILFHPELFKQCEAAFCALLQHSKSLSPWVWIAQLREISRWWWEKAQFRAELIRTSTGAAIRFECSDQATILVRNIQTSESTHPWHGSYRVLESRWMHLRDQSLPLLGISRSAPQDTVSFLQEQGYILAANGDVSQCALQFSDSMLRSFSSETELIDYIESSPAPLIRYWRWPNEAGSAVSMTGDLDALSLGDYAGRIFAR